MPDLTTLTDFALLAAGGDTESRVAEAEINLAAAREAVDIAKDRMAEANHLLNEVNAEINRRGLNRFTTEGTTNV